MARDNQGSWMHQHVEKIVLGASVLLVLVVFVRWVISSPRQVDGVRPDRTDRVQRDKAEQIKKRHEGGRSREWEPPPVGEELTRLQDHPIPVVAPFHRVIVLTPAPPALPIPLGYDPGAGPVLSDLTPSVPAPDRPVVWVGPELPLPGKGEKLDDIFVAHVAAVLDKSKIDTGWTEALEGSRISPEAVFYAVEAQVQEMRPDGTWGPARPVKMRRPRLVDKNGETVGAPEIPAFDGKNSDEIQEAINALAGLGWQGHVLQPNYPDIYLPGHDWVSWRIHLPETEVSLDAKRLLAKEEAGERPRAAPRRRAPPRPTNTVSARRRPSRAPGPGDLYGPMTPEASRELMRRQGWPTEVPRRTGRTPPRRPREAARRTVKPKRAASKDRPEERPTETLAPSLREQLEKGKVIVWFHDVALKSGKVYRYRMRLILVNPLYARAADVKKGSESDAGIATIATPWGAWSGKQRVLKQTEFYVAGYSGTRRTINVDVFAHSLGQRVKKRFSIRTGIGIGQTAAIEVIDPLADAVVARNVDFATGAVAVRLEFNRVVYKGKSPRPSNTAAMVYLDEKGRLLARTEYEDDVDRKYAKLQKEAGRTAKAVEKAKAKAPEPDEVGQDR